MQTAVFPILMFVACTVGLAGGLLLLGNLFNPGRASRVKRMPYESGMDPVHDTRRRFDVRFHLLAIAFLVFDVELLFLYPWATVVRPPESPAAAGEMAPPLGGEVAAEGPGAAAARPVFIGGMVFLALLALGFVYDWRKGVFRWR
jgi:NADH-quinone oxidoreductase subunit A